MGVELASQKAIADVMCRLDSICLEALKKHMVTRMMEDKIFAPYLYEGKYVVAIDGTGLFSADDNPTNTAIQKNI